MKSSNEVDTSEFIDENYLKVLNNMQIPVAVLKPEFNSDGQLTDFIYIFINALAVKSNKVSADLMLGRKLLSLFPEHISNGVFNTMKNTFMNNHPTDFRLESFKGGPGGEVEGIFQLSFTRFQEYLIVNWIDQTVVTEHLSAIKLLTDSNRDLEQFAYIASHDLQEPLRMVTSFTQLLQHRYADKLDADANEYIEFAVDGAKRMKELIDNLLIYSRIGTRNNLWTKVNTGDIVKFILSDLGMIIEENKIKVHYENMPEIYADQSMVSRIFSNLISNAIKYRRNENPEIKISAEKDEAGWIFAVKDNGLGIDSVHFEKIFLIFKRLHSKKEIPGTGIGLAICKRIVDKMGGKIWVESEPGKGSTFYFLIPSPSKEKND